MKNLITIKEALMNFDKDKLYKELYLSYQYIKDETEREQCVYLTFQFIEEAIKLEPIMNHYECIAMVRFSNWYDNEDDIVYSNNDSYMLEIKENTILKDCNHKEYLYQILVDQKKDIENLSINEMNEFLNKFGALEFQFSTYAYELSSTNEILGYYIPQSLIDLYGLEKVLSLILFEMTYFGFEVRTVERKKEEFENELNESINQIIDSNNLKDEINEKNGNLIKQEDNIEDNINKKYGLNLEEIKELLDNTKYKDKNEMMQKLCMVTNLINKLDNYNLLVKDYNMV